LLSDLALDCVDFEAELLLFAATGREEQTHHNSKEKRRPELHAPGRGSLNHRKISCAIRRQMKGQGAFAEKARMIRPAEADHSQCHGMKGGSLSTGRLTRLPLTIE
jgi:hypothetical protein